MHLIHIHMGPDYCDNYRIIVVNLGFISCQTIVCVCWGGGGGGGGGVDYGLT